MPQWNRKYDPTYPSGTIQMPPHCNCHRSAHCCRGTSPRQDPATIRPFSGPGADKASGISAALFCLLCSCRTALYVRSYDFSFSSRAARVLASLFFLQAVQIDQLLGLSGLKVESLSDGIRGGQGKDVRLHAQPILFACLIDDQAEPGQTKAYPGVGKRRIGYHSFLIDTATT